ncbi:DNA repair protein [Nitrosopumilus sp. K4]|uniref:DNA-3-methyladenine glycosylase 2 n=1 Tax=Nitrosopumilus sp. K4 TaxID=2795383 RepID=UPI001BAE010C|nr:DNA glycosylase [Nitrosopumilus sp. K4]QUC64816.1 DNA repair protein [Nitrosopumilus sp. K4]
MIDYNKINLENTINSGQVFLWKKYDGLWYGVNGQDILEINKYGKIKSYQNYRLDFLRKRDNMKKIIQSISKDKIIKNAIKKYLGLRVLRQDPFQCFISFIASSNSNIQKIRNSLENLSIKLGEKIEFDKKEFFLFPDSKTIANSTLEEIKNCGLGYRSKFVINAAKMIESGIIDFDYLKKCDYYEAKKNILQVPGIGNKVADCILLFSLEKFDAFPLDRWMFRILQKYYSEKFNTKTKSITDKQYTLLHEKIIDYFGPYAGYAQQFLFKMERENYQKNWL